MKRRKFLQYSGTASAIGMFTKHPLAMSNNHHPPSDTTTVLFQGDSITDAGRDRASYYPNQGQGLGNGYVFLAAAEISAMYPEKKMHIYNRGVSGNKVFQLAERWEDDCLQLQPDILSILIGVNDYWHTLNGSYAGTANTYQTDYHALLESTLERLPEVKIIICEPFTVKGGKAIKNDQWYPAFDEYRSIAKSLAKEFSLAFVPFQEVFEKALKKGDASLWCPDGVHPSISGAHLMAQAWVKTFQAIF